ncbi:MAG: hypothetical protein Greene101447_4 [Parcubacteria group bacterium Greene1014_47]|nr:MAG: hypothetical protein Greene101447_4 [Parcubacteria group bacterium Greene1014_47]
MTLKKAIVLFLIFFLVPVVFGKVQLAPFADFFQNPSWDAFKTAFSQVFQDDWNHRPYQGQSTCRNRESRALGHPRGLK